MFEKKKIPLGLNKEMCGQCRQPNFPVHFPFKKTTFV